MHEHTYRKECLYILFKLYIKFFAKMAFTKALQHIDQWFVFAEKVFSFTSVNLCSSASIYNSGTYYAFASLSYLDFACVLFAYCILVDVYTNIYIYIYIGICIFSHFALPCSAWFSNISLPKISLSFSIRHEFCFVKVNTLNMYIVCM